MHSISANIKYGIVLLILLACASSVSAVYVLPYPSYMPGNKFYPVSRLLDEAGKLWNFGSITRTKYELHLSDKYLVEAKILFEYSQYLLASDALKRSNIHAAMLPKLIRSAQSDKKDTTALKLMTRDAMEIHTVLLSGMMKEVPKTFVWQPEKSKSTSLPLQQLIDESIMTRESILTDL